METYTSETAFVGHHRNVIEILGKMLVLILLTCTLLGLIVWEWVKSQLGAKEYKVLIQVWLLTSKRDLTRDKKNTAYELRQEFPNDLTHMISGNNKILRKSENGWNRRQEVLSAPSQVPIRKKREASLKGKREPCDLLKSVSPRAPPWLAPQGSF